MARLAACLLALALVAGAGSALAAGNPNCDPAYECQYRYQNLQTGEDYSFDFSSMCSATDYVANDNVAHTYYANVCGKAKQNCLPASWKNTYEYGVAVQVWGGQPSCTPPGCTDPTTGAAVCCTKNCQVLGTGAPFWSLVDPTNPESGGVIARFKGAAASDSDPFWCDFNPQTGSQYEREVHMYFQCAPDQAAPGVLVQAQQNNTNDCRYRLYFNTPLACAGLTGLSGGWIFIILLICLFAAYVMIGSVFGYVNDRVWAFPNRAFWSEFADLVRAGFAFTASGFKKGGGSYSGVGATSGGAGGSGPAFTGSSYQGGTAGGEAAGSGKADAYTDL